MNESRVINSITETIGGTPLLALNRIGAGLNGKIFAKLEYFSPGHSKKDRIALSIIDAAEKDGSLAPGQTVVELTSGNTGTGLALVCKARGYPFVAVISRGNSVERSIMMKALGAEIFLVDQAPHSQPGQVSGEDMKLVEEAAHKLAAERNAFRADQFQNLNNMRAHEFGTGPEILKQTAGGITAFCDFVGSGGTFAGCATAFKNYNAAIRCFVVEPSEAAVMAGKPTTGAGHPIQGGGYSRTNLLIDKKLIDGFIQVSGEEAVQMAHRLAMEEGIFGGVSGGANVAAAIKLLQTEIPGASIATIICDSGLKYMSTGLWEA
ncbi:MAG: cysteine synthase family protein [Chthoniobacterales bacterium]